MHKCGCVPECEVVIEDHLQHAPGHATKAQVRKQEEHKQQWIGAMNALRNPESILPVVEYSNLDTLIERYKSLVLDPNEPMPVATFSKYWADKWINDRTKFELERTLRITIARIEDAIAKKLNSNTCTDEVIRTKDFKLLKHFDSGRLTVDGHMIPYVCGNVNTLPADSKWRTLLPEDQLYQFDGPCLVLGPVQYDGSARAFYIPETVKKLTESWRYKQLQEKAKQEEDARIKERDRLMKIKNSELGQLYDKIKYVKEHAEEFQKTDDIDVGPAIRGGGNADKASIQEVANVG